MPFGRGVAERTKDLSATDFSHPANRKGNLCLLFLFSGEGGFFNAKKYKKPLFCITATAIFTAIAVILEAFFKIPFPFLEISLAFVPMLICGMLLGPFWGAACALLTDFIATSIAGQGNYFIGFAPVVFCSGLIFGFIGILNDKTQKTGVFVVSAGLAALINAVLCEGALKALAINAYMVFVSKSAEALSLEIFFATFAARIGFALVQAVLIVIIALAARKSILPRLKKEIL